MNPPVLDRSHLVLPIRAGSIGGPTVDQVRGKAWRRCAPGWYVPVDTDSSRPAQRIVEAAHGLPPRAGLTGWAALAWMGAPWFVKDGMDIPVAVGDRRLLARRRGVRLTEDWLFSGDLVDVDGLACTRPERSCSFEARRARSLEDAVKVVDLAYASDLVSPAELESYVARLPGRPGIRRLRAAVADANQNVWSPMETVMRLSWLAVVRTPLLVNQPIFDLRGRHILTPDLFDAAAGVVGEYDGREVHLSEGGRRRDLNRENTYRELGLEVVTMMSGDLADRRSFQMRLRSSYGRAGQNRTAQEWTIDQPHWWTDTSTVASRRRIADLAA